MFYSSDYTDGFCSITSMVVCLVQFLFQRYVNICIMLFVAERHMICPDGSSFRGSLRIRDSPQIDSWKTIMISLFFRALLTLKMSAKTRSSSSTRCCTEFVALGLCVSANVRSFPII